MGLLDKLWDDVVAGPQPEKGLGRLRKENVVKNVSGVDPTAMDGGDQGRQSPAVGARSVSQSIYIKPPPLMRSSSFNDEATPTGSPSSLQSPGKSERERMWRHLHPGSGGRMRMERQGSARFDNASPNSPSVYDWMYSPESRNKWQ